MTQSSREKERLRAMPAGSRGAPGISVLGSSCQSWDGHTRWRRCPCHQGTSVDSSQEQTPSAASALFNTRPQSSHCTISALFLRLPLGLTPPCAKSGIREPAVGQEQELGGSAEPAFAHQTEAALVQVRVLAVFPCYALALLLAGSFPCVLCPPV